MNINESVYKIMEDNVKSNAKMGDLYSAITSMVSFSSLGVLAGAVVSAYGNLAAAGSTPILIGGVAGAALGLAGEAARRYHDRLASLTKPITGPVNNIDNDTLFENFFDIHYHSQNADPLKAALFDNFIKHASETRFSSLKEYLENSDTDAAKEMKKQLLQHQEKDLSSSMLDLVERKAQSETPIESQIKASSKGLRELLKDTGLPDLPHAAYSRALDDAKKANSCVTADHITESFIIDTVTNAKSVTDLPGESPALLSALEAKVSELKDTLPTNHYDEITKVASNSGQVSTAPRLSEPVVSPHLSPSSALRL